MNSPFYDLIHGSDRTLILQENEFFIAALEKKPLVLGHVVVVSKIQRDHLFDLPETSLASLLVFSKNIAQAIQKTVSCTKVGVAVLGLETRHAHLHLVPVNTAGDLNFTRPKLSPDAQSLAELTTRLRNALAP